MKKKIRGLGSYTVLKRQKKNRILTPKKDSLEIQVARGSTEKEAQRLTPLSLIVFANPKGPRLLTIVIS